MIAVILARGGSKGIPNKNISLLAGKPLIAHTIIAALNSKSIDRVIVSSDSEKILSVANTYGAECLLRPAELSGDFASSCDAMAHCLSWCLKNKIIPNDSLSVLLQPTSPLRTSLHIDTAYKILLDNKFDSIISVKREDSAILKAFIAQPDGTLSAGFNSDFPFCPRQSLPPAFMANGAIYIFNIYDFLKNSSFMQGRCGYYEMDEMSSLDIDSLDDLMLADKFLNSVVKV